MDVEEDGDFAKYSDDSDVHEMEKQPVENDQWNNPYPLVDDDDFSKKESKDDGEKETESSDSSESDISLDTEDSEEKTAEAAQPEDDMAEQMKSLVGEEERWHVVPRFVHEEWEPDPDRSD